MDFYTFSLIAFPLLTIIIVCLIISLINDTRRPRLSTSSYHPEQILTQLRQNPNAVGYYDIRSYHDWNIAQDNIEQGRLWAILDIHPFGREQQHWEVWVNGEKYATRYSLAAANEAMTEAERKYGRRRGI